jgi:RNA polymerase subunit RPABC4/transcription elongation factor Spt4
MAEEFDYFCGECDAQVQEDFEFCPSCGTDIGDTGEDEPEEELADLGEKLQRAVEGRTRAGSSASGRGAGPLEKAFEAEQRRLGRPVRPTSVAAGRGAGSSRSGSPTCPECGRRISLSANICPNCGRPTHWSRRKWRDSSGAENSKRMMFFVGLLVFLVAIYVLASQARWEAVFWT